MTTRYYYVGAGLDDIHSSLMRIDVPDGGDLDDGTNGEVFIHRDLVWRSCDVVRRVFGNGEFNPLSEADAMKLQTAIIAGRSATV